MILPNYFLADLPPEATLSPAMITEACQTLKRNRERYLAGRSTEQLIKTLSDVAEGWLQPENRFRKLALEHAGVQASACSPDTLKRELQHCPRLPILSVLTPAPARMLRMARR